MANKSSKKGQANGAKQQLQRKPRVLWATAHCLLDTSSGASLSVREMLRQLVNHGYDVAVLGATVFDSEHGLSKFPDRWRSLIGKEEYLCVKDSPLDHHLLVTASTDRSLMTAQESDQWYGHYIRTLDTFKPDLVFFYGGKTLDLLIPDEAKQRGIPSVAYLVNGNYSGTRWFRDVSLIITDSHATADLYQRQEGIIPVPVGKFIDPAMVKATVHTRKNLLFINPLLEKGAGIVIQLAMLLEKRRPDIQFEVVECCGNWPALVKESTFHYEGVSREQLDNVVVTPNTHDMRPIYSRARLLIAPSLCWESGSRVLGEAMLNGIPAIITDRGGSPEMIGNGGFMVILPEVCYEKPYNKFLKKSLLQPLAEKIIQLYDNDALYSDYVSRAWHAGESLYDLDTATERLMTAFYLFIQQLAGDK